MKTTEQRFVEKIHACRDGDLCWLWIGAKKPSGYGNFYMLGRYETAHRASWLLFKGPIPAGRYVMHKCDNPPCVNPAHLSVGTPKANQDDCRAKGRTRKRTYISDEHCLEIIDLRRSGVPLKRLAETYLCSEAQVSLIARGLSRAGVVFHTVARAE